MSHFVAFLRAINVGGRVVKMEQPLAGNTDNFHFHDRELHWACRTKISDSAVSGAMFEKKLAMPMTLRNSNTVRKVAAAHPSN